MADLCEDDDDEGSVIPKLLEEDHNLEHEILESNSLSTSYMKLP